jgi:hypothetical protein
MLPRGAVAKGDRGVTARELTAILDTCEGLLLGVCIGGPRRRLDLLLLSAATTSIGRARGTVVHPELDGSVTSWKLATVLYASVSRLLHVGVSAPR